MLHPPGSECVAWLDGPCDGGIGDTTRHRMAQQCLWQGCTGCSSVSRRRCESGRCRLQSRKSANISRAHIAPDLPVVSSSVLVPASTFTQLPPVLTTVRTVFTPVCNRTCCLAMRACSGINTLVYTGVETLRLTHWTQQPGGPRLRALSLRQYQGSASCYPGEPTQVPQERQGRGRAPYTPRKP